MLAHTELIEIYFLQTMLVNPRKVHDFAHGLRDPTNMTIKSPKSQILVSLALDLVALAAGAALWFYQFGMGFVGSAWAWPLVGLQVAGAFALGYASSRWLAKESRIHAVVRFVLYEVGHIYMWVWAGANCSASGTIEFSVGFFLLPIFADVLVWWFGVKKRF